MNPRALVVLAVGMASFVLLFVWLRPDAGIPTQQEGDVADGAAAVIEAVQPEVISIGIQGGNRVSGPKVIQVYQGDTVALEFLSDKDAELHLHGYDHRLKLKAGTPLKHEFIAEHSGRFEYELHGHHAHHALGVIEVLPQ